MYMQPSDFEDCLEAIFIIESEKRPVTVSDIAQVIGMNEGKCREIVDQLVTEGKVELDSDNEIRFTERGKLIAEKVVQKHRTLECFFTEMLGMDADVASREACKLEHEVSDETIERLSSYIEVPCPRYGRRGMGRKRERIPYKTLLDFNEGAEIRVIMVGGCVWNRRLIDLGIVPGELLQIRRKLRNRSILVHVKGCDVALSPEIAQMIFVE